MIYFKKEKGVLCICFIVITIIFVTVGFAAHGSSETKKTKDPLKKQPPQFENFSITEQFKGKPARIKFSANSRALRFYTTIIDGVKNGPNFAGHLTIVSWGCGTSCRSGAIINVKTGDIYYPLPFTSELGLEFRIDSKLLIVNPPGIIKEIFGNSPSQIPDWVHTTYYIWENNQLIDITLQKGNFSRI